MSPRQLILLCLLLPSTAFAQLETMAVLPSVGVLEYELDGVVEASKQATLSAEVSGRIEKVNFDVDDYVRKGEIILTIRDNEYRAGLQKAEASLAEASAGLQDAKQEFRRRQKLRDQKLISQENFDRAKANLKTAEARVESAQAVVSEAQEQLDRTILRAPYSGVVVERFVEPGESTQVGQKIMSGYAQGQLRVKANVPQSLIAAVRERRTARVLLLESDTSINASQITIYPFANPKNHSFPVRIELPENELAIFPGMLVKVAFAIGTTKRLLIPASALVQRSEVNAVYVLDQQGRVSLRQVRPGNRFGEQIEILAGIYAGEQVALDPVRAGIELKTQLGAQ